MQAYEISRTGMDVEWRRMEVIAQNFANTGTTRTADGTPYQPMYLVSGPAMPGNFRSMLQSNVAHSSFSGAAVYGVESSNAPPNRVLEPNHPHADANGFVSYPGFDHASEMMLMIKTSRSYEANAIVMNAARAMYSKALEIGGRS